MADRLSIPTTIHPADPAPIAGLAPPPMALLLGWQRAVRAGQSTQAGEYRLLLDSLTDDEPTWEDAAWQ